MDWYAWLCRAGLHPDVAFEYALLFARNELGATDVRHLDHEFLLSMGVTVAKHRLEILKLARKDPPSSPSSSSSHGRAAVAAAAITVALPWRATRLLAAAVHRSACSALARLRASLSRGRERDRDRAVAAGLLATPRLPLLRHRGGRVAHSSWTKIASSPVAVRGGTGKLPLPLPMLRHIGKPVLLTNSCAAGKWRGDGAAVRKLPAPAGSIAACLVSTTDDVCSCDDDEEGDGSDEEVVVVDVVGEEMRWESMFQDLKPT